MFPAFTSTRQYPLVFLASLVLSVGLCPCLLRLPHGVLQSLRLPGLCFVCCRPTRPFANHISSLLTFSDEEMEALRQRAREWLVRD